MTAAKPLLLIVDDDPLISESLGFAFAQALDVITSHSRPHALAMLRQLRQAPQIALIDLGLPPFPHRPDEGFALIGDLLALSPEMKIIVLSGQNDEENARHARTLGAVDFVGKPCDPGRLSALFQQTLNFPGKIENQPLAGLIGESLPAQRLRLQLGQFANLAFPVLIEGESGSGKDIVASHYLHQLTNRRDKPFLALNNNGCRSVGHFKDFKNLGNSADSEKIFHFRLINAYVILCNCPENFIFLVNFFNEF